MKILLFLFLLLPCSPILAQKVKVSVSHQPYETFKSAFGGGLKGVGLYQATACNLSDESVRVSEGLLAQAVETRVSTVNPALALTTASRAKSSSKKAKIARALQYALLGAAAYTAGGTIAATGAIRVSLVAGQGIAGKVADDASKDAGLDFNVIASFLSADRSISLDGRACASRLTFGEYKKSLAPYEVFIQ